MRAGSLRHVAAIQIRQEGGVQGSGVPSRGGGYVLEQPRRVSIEPLSGREMLEAQQITGHTLVKVRMRYYEGLNSVDYRIVVDGRIFDIHSVQHTMERRRETIALAYEKVVSVVA